MPWNTNNQPTDNKWSLNFFIYFIVDKLITYKMQNIFI